MPHVIGMIGVARSGKTTCAEYFRYVMGDRNISSEIMSFAGPLKEGLATMGVTKDVYPELYRSMAQYIGTDVLRKHNDNWWVDLMENNISQSQKRVVLIDDVRFPNEVELVQRLGGVLVFVNSGNRLDLTQPLYEHASEKLAMLYQTGKENMKQDFRYVHYNGGTDDEHQMGCVKLAETIISDRGVDLRHEWI